MPHDDALDGSLGRSGGPEPANSGDHNTENYSNGISTDTALEKDREPASGSSDIANQSETPNSDEPKPDEPKPDESKPDESKPDESKPDESKPDEPKPDEPKPDEPKSAKRRKPKRKTEDASAAESDVDSQSEADLEYEYATRSYGSLDSLEARRARAEKRMKQASLYTRLVEDRLAALENELKELRESSRAGKTDAEASNAPDEPAKQSSGDADEKKPEPARPLHALEIKRMSWAEFQVKPRWRAVGEEWTHAPEVDATPGSVLEVLTEVPQVTLRARRRFRHPVLAAPRAEGNDKIRDQAASSRADGNSKVGSAMPERLRMRSSTLVKTVEKITELDICSSSHHKIIFLRPFKVLVVYQDKIRNYLQELEEKHKGREENGEGSSSSQSAETPSGAVDTPPSTDNDQAGTPSADQDASSPSAPNETETYEALEHLRLLVRFMDEDLKPLWELRQKLAAGTLRKVFFADLWHIFQCGTEIRTPGNSQIQMYRVVKVTGGRDILNPGDPASDVAAEKVEGYVPGSFVIECFRLDFDGVKYGPVHRTFTIPRYDAERDVTLLPVYPLACDANQAEIRQRLLDRGEKFTIFSRPSHTAHKQYTGLSADKQQEQIDSQVIVDFHLGFTKKPDWKYELGVGTLVSHDNRETDEASQNLGTCGSEGCCGNDYIYRDYQVDDKAYTTFMADNKHLLEPVQDVNELEEEKILLPYRAYGFVLRSRKWATFDIDLLKDVGYNDGWKDLVLPKDHKNTVLALVQNHARGPAQQQTQNNVYSSMDLVRGKGKGLIILLHGEPGVGKTSTAECVADHTKRPLFPITCGDIGDTAQSVEENLENNFQLAHKWGCVLLLDEADVFLQKRTKTDLKRNAIVSVFLRTLEYYSGILFLTTNRVGSIDQAFKSRIHLSLYYPKLDKGTTVTIWKNNLARIRNQYKKDGKKVDIDRKDILQYARLHFDELRRNKNRTGPWNGRQIRNAFQTAMALAEYEASGSRPQLCRSHFETVAKASEQFDLYLKSVYLGRNDEDIALAEQMRNDGFTLADKNAKRQASSRSQRERQQQQQQQQQQQSGKTSSKKKPRPETEDEDDDDDDTDDDFDDSDDEDDEDEDDTDASEEVGKERGEVGNVSDKEDDDDEDDDDDDEESEEEPRKPAKSNKASSKASSKAKTKAKDEPKKKKNAAEDQEPVPGIKRSQTKRTDSKKGSKSSK